MIHGLQEALKALTTDRTVSIPGGGAQEGFQFAVRLIKKRIDELDKEHSKDHDQG